MLDMIEQRMATQLPSTASKSVMEGFMQEGSSLQMRVFLKVLSNYLQRPTPYVSSKLIQILNKSDISTEEMQEQVTAIFEHMVSQGAGTKKAEKKYTTGQLATFFGVTVATINNWLRDGRIIGAQKMGANKQYRIPETALYQSAAGEEIPIYEIAKLYEKEQKQTTLREMTPLQRQKDLLDSIVYFETKYGGEYERTLGSKKEAALTSLEKRDADEWQYLLQCINGANG